MPRVCQLFTGASLLISAFVTSCTVSQLQFFFHPLPPSAMFLLPSFMFLANSADSFPTPTHRGAILYTTMTHNFPLAIQLLRLSHSVLTCTRIACLSILPATFRAAFPTHGRHQYHIDTPLTRTAHLMPGFARVPSPTSHTLEACKDVHSSVDPISTL